MPQLSVPLGLAPAACEFLAKLCSDFFLYLLAPDQELLARSLSRHISKYLTVVKQVSAMAVLLESHKDTVPEVIQFSM